MGGRKREERLAIGSMPWVAFMASALGDTRDGGSPDPTSGKIYGGFGSRVIQLGLKYSFRIARAWSMLPCSRSGRRIFTVLILGLTLRGGRAAFSLAET